MARVSTCIAMEQAGCKKLDVRHSKKVVSGWLNTSVLYSVPQPVGSGSERRNQNAENMFTKVSEYFAEAPKTRALFFTIYYPKY